MTKPRRSAASRVLWAGGRPGEREPLARIILFCHGDSKKSIAHTYDTIVGMPKNPSIHIGGRLFERSPPYHVATRWYSATYVIFLGQFTGVCELEWPECGAFWSALPIFVDRWPRTPCTIDRDGKRSKKRRIRAILARNPRRPCPQKSRIPWKPI